MSMRVTMTQARMGESGSVLAAGSTYTVSDAFGAMLVGGGYATDTDRALTPATTNWSPAATTAGTYLVSAYGKALMPTGNDDSALISQFVQDMAASGIEARLGPGDFVIGSPMTWRSRLKLGKWGDKGIGLKVRGNGPGNTRLLDATAGTAPMIWVNCPTSAGIGKRNYLTDLGGFSIVRAPGGTEIAAGSTSGEAFRAAPVGEVLEVFHTTRLKDIFFDGFDACVSLSDATLFEGDTLWFCEFLKGFRLGYNIDIFRLKHSMFGSEQFGTTYRNSSVAIDTGWSDGFNILGGFNCFELDMVWAMKIGQFMHHASIDRMISWRHVYMEDVRQYYQADCSALTAQTPFYLSVDYCHFSHMDLNDDVSYPKFDYGGANNPLHRLRITNTSGDGVPLNAPVVIQNNNGSIDWENNRFKASATYGHLRSLFAGWSNQVRTLPNDGAGAYRFANYGGGLCKMNACDPIEVAQSPSAGGTMQMDQLTGDVYVVTMPDGDITLTQRSYNPSGFNTGTRMRIRLLAPATVAANRTITYGTGLKMPTSTITMATTDATKRRLLEIECIDASNNKWVQVADSGWQV